MPQHRSNISNGLPASDLSSTEAPESAAKYRGLLEAAPDAMVVVDQGGHIVLLNVQAEKQFGYHRDELLGQPITNIIPIGFAERIIADSTRSAADALAQQIGTGIELTAIRKDGSEFPIEIMLSPLQSAEGILVTAAIRDISVRRAAELHLAHMAHHDYLTGLPNRTLLNDRISQAVALAARHKRQAALLFIDLDGFKHINDALGHPMGDKLLQSVGERLVTSVRESDTVSRYGGDEFVILLSEVGGVKDAANTVTRILQAIAMVHPIAADNLYVTASVGVSIYPDDGRNAETLIKNADTAMYQAKGDGRQCYRFFKPAMNVRAVQRQSIEVGLRSAIIRHEFKLHYQPKVDIVSGQIVGSEALIRWSHPTQGMVPPAEFIPIAEECGLIIPIGGWVMREACTQARMWMDAGLPAATVAVNVSAKEFQNEHFLDNVLSVLKDTGLDPSSLELELTESVLMKRVESSASILKALRDHGVRVALDDFGTGYSSLNYLQRFPIDALKIDQSFVRQISTGEHDATLVAAVIKMGQSLGLRVIAEGVETLDELQFLQSHGCNEAQGYYFSRPVPAEQFAALLVGSFGRAHSRGLEPDSEPSRSQAGSLLPASLPSDA